MYITVSADSNIVYNIMQDQMSVKGSLEFILQICFVSQRKQNPNHCIYKYKNNEILPFAATGKAGSISSQCVVQNFLTVTRKEPKYIFRQKK